MTKITIAEDDPRLADALKDILLENGYDARTVNDFANTEAEIKRLNSDLVLLDINIPNLNGERILKNLRKTSNVPVIMLTSRTSEIDEIISMSYGADDFITKPYNPQILLLRIEAVLNRNRADGSTIRYKDLVVSPLKSELEYRENREILTKNELVILSFLIKNSGKIVSRADIMDYLWSDDKFVDDNTLTVNINRLRKKLTDLGLENLIKTRRSQGYILE